MSDARWIEVMDSMAAAARHYDSFDVQQAGRAIAAARTIADGLIRAVEAFKAQVGPQAGAFA